MNLKSVVLKIYLSKAYDHIKWYFIELLLIHVGFDIHFISRIMSCLTSISFVVLIDGSISNFFQGRCGLRQGFPLSPIMFLYVVEILSLILNDANRRRYFQGVLLPQIPSITHFLFVNDIIILWNGSTRYFRKLSNILALFMSVVVLSLR